VYVSSKNTDQTSPNVASHGTIIGPRYMWKIAVYWLCVSESEHIVLVLLVPN